MPRLFGALFLGLHLPLGCVLGERSRVEGRSRGYDHNRVHVVFTRLDLVESNERARERDFVSEKRLLERVKIFFVY